MSFSFVNAAPAAGTVNTARTGGNVYVASTAGAAALVGANANIWEDQHDGRGGGIWPWDAWSNFYPSPVAAGTLASGAHAGGDYGSGFVYTNTGSFFYGDDGNHRAMRDVHTAGTITLAASPWTGFGNAVTTSGLTSAGSGLVTNYDQITLTSSGFDIEFKIKPTAPSASTEVVWGKLSTSAPGQQAFFRYDTTNKFECGATDGTSTLRFAHLGATTPTAGVTYDIACDFDGTTLRLFVNGTQEASVAMTSGLIGGDATGWYFGTPAPGFPAAQVMNATVDELRVSTASRHTSGYTPATSPFTSDASTALLAHFDNAEVQAYVTGLADPTGGTGAVALSADGNSTSFGLTYTAGGVGTSGYSPTSSVWVADDPTYAPAATPGAIAGGMALGATSLGSGTSFRRITAHYFKSGTGSDLWNLYPAAVPVTQPSLPGNTSFSATNTGAGVVRLWGPQISETVASDPPLLDGSSSAAVVSLDSSKLAKVLQSNGNLYIKTSLLEDNYELVPTGTGPTPRDMFSFVSADGTTALGFNANATMHAVVNNTTPLADGGGAQLQEVRGWYKGDGEMTYYMWVRPGTDGKQGYEQRYQGCLSTVTSAAGAPVMHTPTAVYLGSNAGAAGSSQMRRYTSWSFDVFDEWAAEGIVIGDSQSTEVYPSHESPCTWIYSLAQSRARPGIYDQAVSGDVICAPAGGAGVGTCIAGDGGQYDKLRTSIYGTNPTYGNAIKWANIMVGLNDTKAGVSAANTAGRLQSLLNLVHSVLPNAVIELYTQWPCAQHAGCTWSTVSTYNSDIEGTGPNPITCPSGATCHVHTYASSWGPSGGAILDDNTGTGTVLSQYSNGSDVHLNDLGSKLAFEYMSSRLTADGLLP